MGEIVAEDATAVPGIDLSAGPGPAGRLWGVVRCMRPRQWIKNLACFAGLIFSGQLLRLGSLGRAGLAFAGFCLAASAVYLLNDVYDRKLDRQHPGKRSRPVASGLLPPSWALSAAALLLAAAVASSVPLGRTCAAVLGMYLALNVAYSLRLKHTLLLDVVIIACGFVLRVLYGVYAIGVLPSPWIALCMFFLALFLGFAKRRSELKEVGTLGEHRRPVLRKYDVAYLDHQLGIAAAMAISSYSLYTVMGRPGDASLVITVPLVAYGVCRYMYMVQVHGKGDMPERQLVSDPVSLAIVGLWAALCTACLYTRVFQGFFLER